MNHVGSEAAQSILKGLRDLWRDLARSSWLPDDRALKPDLPDPDLPRLRRRMQECLDGRGGEVSARLRAAQLGRTYLTLNEQGRARFLTLLAEAFDTDRASVTEAIDAYLEASEEQLGEAEHRLRSALIAPRRRLLTQFNELPEGTKFLVDLRAELLGLLPGTPALRALDRDLRELLTTWFDVGFLELQRISWNSPASLLEKLISYEAVHEIESWSDLRNRLETDRRCYAFFHPHMPGEPLIFVEIALVDRMATSIQALLDESTPELPPEEAKTAIFYSISNTQRGLRGISFGSFLIKRVIDDLTRDFPGLRTFATLSPIPGFRRWLDGRIREELDLLTERETRALAETGSGSLAQLLATPEWWKREPIRRALESPLMRLCARYLVEERREGRPLDPVARFHLGNGASIVSLNWGADLSPKGIRQSAGIMVNYGYRQDDIEKNHEAYRGKGEVKTSPAVRRWLRAG